MPKKQSPQPITPYLADLTNSDHKLRRAAVKGLSKTRNPDAYPYLVAALQDPTLAVVFHAIRGLETLGDPRAIPELLTLLGNATSCDVCDEVGAALVMFDAEAVAAVIETLHSPVPRARAVAVNVLARIRDPRAVEPIIALLDDSESWPVGASLSALRVFKDARSREPLAAFLSRPDDAIPTEGHTTAEDHKRTAAFALAELGDPRALETLGQSFYQEGRACVETIQQLGKIDDPRVRPLIQMYIDADPDSLCASQARATLEHLDARGL